MKMTVLALAGAMALSACETTGGYGYNDGYHSGGSRLSQCTRNALVGAGVGAVVGAVTAPDGNRGENAAIGAAVGGLGTYGVCRWLRARDQANIERGYRQALNDNRPYNGSWQSDEGAQRSVYVDRPVVDPNRSDCRRITATVTDPQYGREQLPPETYCRNASGQWVPV
ncbi:MAG: YMGG-like glycine zipper-containing protein [Hyphomonadaceae bacterium]